MSEELNKPTEETIVENDANTFNKMNEIVDEQLSESNTGSEQPKVEEEKSEPVIEDKEPVIEEQPKVETPVVEGGQPPVTEEQPKVETPAVENEQPPVIEEQPKVETPVVEGGQPPVTEEQPKVETPPVTEIPPVEGANPNEGEGEDKKPPIEGEQPNVVYDGELSAELVELIRGENLFNYDIVGKHFVNGEISKETLKPFHIDFVGAGMCSTKEHYRILGLLNEMFGSVKNGKHANEETEVSEEE